MNEKINRNTQIASGIRIYIYMYKSKNLVFKPLYYDKCIYKIIKATLIKHTNTPTIEIFVLTTEY